MGSALLRSNKRGVYSWSHLIPSLDKVESMKSNYWSLKLSKRSTGKRGIQCALSNCTFILIFILIIKVAKHSTGLLYCIKISGQIVHVGILIIRPKYVKILFSFFFFNLFIYLYIYSYIDVTNLLKYIQTPITIMISYLKKGSRFQLKMRSHVKIKVPLVLLLCILWVK